MSQPTPPIDALLDVLYQAGRALQLPADQHDRLRNVRDAILARARLLAEQLAAEQARVKDLEAKLAEYAKSAPAADAANVAPAGAGAADKA